MSSCALQVVNSYADDGRASLLQPSESETFLMCFVHSISGESNAEAMLVIAVN